MRVKKKVNFKRMKKRVTDTEKSIWLLASDIIIGIKNRTLKGTDMYLMKFEAYTEQYKAYKGSKGRSTMPNLTFRGTMLNSMQYKKISNGVRLYFNAVNERVKASANHNGYKRYFFGIDKNQSKYITKRLREIFRRT